MTVKKHEVSVFPLASVTVYVTWRLSPTLKNVPGEMSATMDAIPAKSVAVGAVQEMTVPGTPSSTDWAMFAGQSVTVGSVVSTTRRWKAESIELMLV